MASCDMARETFSKWSARGTFPRSDDLYAMSRALGVSMDYLFTGEEANMGNYAEYLPFLEKASESSIESIRKLLDMPEKKAGSSGIRAS